MIITTLYPRLNQQLFPDVKNQTVIKSLMVFRRTFAASSGSYSAKMRSPRTWRCPRTPSSNRSLAASSPNFCPSGEESQGEPCSQIAPPTTCRHPAAVEVLRLRIKMCWLREKSYGFFGTATSRTICWKSWCLRSSRKSRTFPAPGKMSCRTKQGLCCTRLSITSLKGMLNVQHF